MVCQLMAVKKTSFPEMESSGSVVCAYERAKDWRFQPNGDIRSHPGETIKVIDKPMARSGIGLEDGYQTLCFYILMPPKRTSTSAAPTMTQAAIWQLVADSVDAALECTKLGNHGNEVKKMEDEFYNLVVKGNDLKIYARIFQELAVLCPNMVPNTKKLMEAFIWGLPKSIEGNVTASKPQTLEKTLP
ncbi:hypothetical protein Tco_1082712 [Tanacetum coccineum]|uniref:Reverse transcriptase domain-containing protein n=1 Tax=Tanacetum coccineum TaxID=301880 RepID=A0ABQ5I2V4_9ASTR